MKMVIKVTAYILLAVVAALISCKKETSCEGCSEKNKLPIAVAGPDQDITLPTDSISLDGTASSDPDGSISNYLWTKISGPSSFNISNTTSALAVSKNLVAGSYLFELKVTDNGGLSAKDTMRVIVDSVLTTNHPPTANAGTDTTITLSSNIIKLDGSRSTDPENNIIGYTWSKISGPSSFNIANANAVQTQITNLVQGVYKFELKVTDGGGLFSKDTVQVVVNTAGAVNHPPVANARANQTIILPTNIVNLDGSGSADPDNNITNYTWSKIFGPSSFYILNLNAAQTQVTNLVKGVYKFELKVTDAGGLFSKDTVDVTVVTNVECNNRPVVNVQLIPVGTLSQARAGIAVASAGAKIVFAGGYGSGNGSSRVDIYDTVTHSWSTAELSIARDNIAAVAFGNKIFFAGGENGDGTAFEDVYSVLDIYDASTNTWTVSN